jgi:hypothetical protein
MWIKFKFKLILNKIKKYPYILSVRTRPESCFLVVILRNPANCGKTKDLKGIWFPADALLILSCLSRA